MSVPFSRRLLFSGALVARPVSRLLSVLSLGFGKKSRVEAATELRERLAIQQGKRLESSMATNHDEDALPARIACFSKGLAKNEHGEVQPAAYNALLTAIQSGKHSDFEQIPRGGGRKLNNPQAAYSFDLEGGDPHTFNISAPPSLTCEALAVEASELYWQALARDVPFSNFGKAVVLQQATEHLSVTPESLFRGLTRGDAKGPYVSQFLLKPIPYGSAKVNQQYSVPRPGSDFVTTLGEWSQIQTGIPPWREATYDSVPRYIRNGRDLAEYVHYDFPYQAFLNAALILFNAGPKSILNCNAFKSPSNPYRYSTIEEGFVTFGQAEVTDWLGRVTTAALKAAYCQKWMVHRRLRPEELGGLVQRTKAGQRQYPLHESLMGSEAVRAVFMHTGSYLLPQAYPEGCPLHPSYPAGHAVIAGACSVVLKACFDGSMLLPGCVEPSADGKSLVPRPDYSPTVGDEIDKLAFNIAMARNWAGIHYRSDCVAGLRLGEDVAISILQDLACTCTEDFPGFSFKRFSGTEVHITPGGELIESGMNL